MTTIIIDPGHGGIDPGATSGSAHEADYTLRIGKLVAAKLKEAGVQTFLTRESDQLAGGGDDRSKSLSWRVRFAKEKKADLFVSIHLNAFNGKASGTEVLLNDADATTTGLATSIGNAIAKIMGGTHGALLKNRDDLRVLKKDNVSRAMLIEVGFIDNPSDLAKINQNLSAIVDAIAAPLVAFAGGKVSIPKTDVPDYHGHAFENAIEYVMKDGIMSGVGGKNFSPDEPLTRGQMAALIQRLDARYQNPKK